MENNHFPQFNLYGGYIHGHGQHTPRPQGEERLGLPDRLWKVAECSYI